MIGRTVSHYQIIEKLGKGGMGEIYKALDPRLNRFVAIKVLPTEMSTDPARRRRFLQEAQAASGLNHPNIITIYDVVLEQETEFMLMEFVAGRTLLDLIPKGGLRIPQVLNYSVQIADALTAAHAAGIVHRDLKPGNVMITDSGFVKILDFGLAKLDSGAFSPGDDTETVIAATLTVEGSILGTVHYMSPEQAQGFRVDARSDIFSFGVLLYEMVTGIRPFSGDSPISTLSAILRDEAKPVSEITPEVPKPMQEVIWRCLRKNPEDRWQSMQEVRTVLTALKQESGSSLVVHKQMAAPPHRRSKALIPVIAGVLIPVLAVGLWWFARHPSPKPSASPVATDTTRPVEAPPVNPGRRAQIPAPGPDKATDKPNPFGQPDASARTSTPPLPVVDPAKTEPHGSLVMLIVDGSPLSLTLADDILATAVAGTPIHFTASKDIEVGGNVAIRKGAVAKGEIAQEGKKKFIAFGSKMMLQLNSVEAADNHILKLRAVPKRGQLSRPVDQGGRTKSKGVAALAGTQYLGYIDGDQSVTAQK